eukprot:CAMPEP_0182490718 /NCGR_PEP_ID=MMETSP1321-20130603/474_1 /TAXON_ID=91990 /ORGANISM="Bolidomonas sp., Strain RCC1657" /LENGTH=1006 /DNA_ID=CAMNT_0024692943 /DNA_START=67 /DNA_END=3084 /DNA_ORIENTATION=-
MELPTRVPPPVSPESSVTQNEEEVVKNFSEGAGERIEHSIEQPPDDAKPETESKEEKNVESVERVTDVQVTDDQVTLPNPITVATPPEDQQSDQPASLSPSSTPCPSPQLVTECHFFYSALLCAQSSLLPLTLFWRGWDKADGRFWEFWMPTLLPQTLGAVLISWVLKPRRSDWYYKAFLYLQYFAYCSTFIFGILAKDDWVFTLCAAVIIQGGILKLLEKLRRTIASLADDELSEYLKHTVLKYGLIVGMGQLLFISLISIGCDGNAYDFRQCRRALTSQTGLGLMLLIALGVNIISGIFPRRILLKHTVKVKRVVALDLPLGEIIQCILGLVAIGCGMYILGLMTGGAWGDFGEYKEQYVLIYTIIIGCGSLISVAIWKWAIIWREMRQADAPELEQPQAEDEVPMTEASSIWFYISILAILLQTTLSILYSLTLDDMLQFSSSLIYPLVVILYVAALLSQPRRESVQHRRKLKLHFALFVWVGEAATGLASFRMGDFGALMVSLFRAVMFTVAFYFGLKLRRMISELPDKDLEAFLTDTIFSRGLLTFIYALFFSFQVVGCSFERGSIGRCSNTSSIATFITLFLLLTWFISIMHSSLRKEWRKELTLTNEQLASVSGIPYLLLAQGFLTLIIKTCHLFFLSTITAYYSYETTLAVFALLGISASILSVILTAYSINRTKKHNESECERVEEELDDLAINEFSWWYNAISFALTSTHSILRVAYAFNLIQIYGLLADIILPYSALSFTLSLLTKPKRRDAAYMRFLIFQLITFVLPEMISSVMSNLRMGEVFSGVCYAVVGMPLWYFSFKHMLRIREASASLPPKELSEFLCQTVLVRGLLALGPLVFFSFEIISCAMSQYSIVNGQCANTSTASFYLSLILIVVTLLSVTNKAAPNSVQRAITWDYSHMATLNLVWWQRLQGGFVVITVVASLCLWGGFGEGDQNAIYPLAGITGFLAAVLAWNFGSYALIKTHDDLRQSNTAQLESVRSARVISTGELSND